MAAPELAASKLPQAQASGHRIVGVTGRGRVVRLLVQAEVAQAYLALGRPAVPLRALVRR